MDGQEYLNKISAELQPKTQKQKEGRLGPKIFIIVAIGVVAFILIAILGAALGGPNKGEKSKTFQLLAHLENTTEMIAEYQPSVKSSDLRSSSASLYSVLSNTKSELTEYATDKYKLKAMKDIDKNILEQAKTEQDALNEELFKGKINGILDRVYAYKMAYEISMLKLQEDDLYTVTHNDTLKDILNKSYDSLENLYDKFNNFSEAK